VSSAAIWVLDNRYQLRWLPVHWMFAQWVHRAGARDGPNARGNRTASFSHSVLSLTHSLLRVTGCVLRPPCSTDLQQQPMRHQQSPESRTIWLIHVVRGLPAGRFQPCCGVSPDIHGELQSHMCWRAVWEVTDVTEDGVTASGYGAENAWEIRAVRYSPVGDEVIPWNVKNA